ncbi:TnpV protein [Coprobacillus sp. AF13-15]|uniref:TnpV protein n=1 Tax=Faecalibacillus intestinalis TaxID=1982626 RepID=UPI000E484233|nr:TnpV protein [Coprobacillus sp. TM10-10]RHS03619.1 TnpV protein [Coprobacillus sp. AF13-4LB]RHS14641.1 TnpV protein [Coprobacillus sp. AF13-25]RHS14701.1 TnpV protein [Coprobacillus sp. AF13-15]
MIKLIKMKGVLSMEQITYSTVGDYQMPNLTVDKEIPLGKYAMMKKKYLKEQQPEILFSLRVRNQLNSYLMETEKKANEMMEMLMKELLTKNPAPNKEIHQMEWVQHMNNLQKTAEEIILKEIIYN